MTLYDIQVSRGGQLGVIFEMSSFFGASSAPFPQRNSVFSQSAQVSLPSQQTFNSSFTKTDAVMSDGSNGITSKGTGEINLSVSLFTRLLCVDCEGFRMYKLSYA